MKYKIKISYQTGNSFSNEDISSYLDGEFDLDIAKINLKAIKEHYELYKKLDNFRYSNYKSKQDILKEYADKWWFVEKLNTVAIKGNTSFVITNNKVELHKKKGYTITKEYDEYYGGNCMNIQLNKDKSIQMGCFWCGYFERLYGAEIENVDSDTKFEV